MYVFIFHLNSSKFQFENHMRILEARKGAYSKRQHHSRSHSHLDRNIYSPSPKNHGLFLKSRKKIQYIPSNVSILVPLELPFKAIDSLIFRKVRNTRKRDKINFVFIMLRHIDNWIFKQIWVSYQKNNVK